MSGISTITLNQDSSLSVESFDTCIIANSLVLAGLPKEISLSGDPIFHSSITINPQDSTDPQIADLVDKLEALRDGTTTDPDFT